MYCDVSDNVTTQLRDLKTVDVHVVLSLKEYGTQIS